MSHPLFPPKDNDDGDDERDLSFIQIARYEATGLVGAPRMYSAEELTGPEDLHRMFGGGVYELTARDKNRARITARVKLALAGEPRPLVPVAAPPPPPPPAPVMHAPQSGPTDSILAFMTMQAQNQQTFFQSMMQMQASASQTALAQTQENSRALVAAMAELFRGAHATQTAGGASSIAQFKEAMELGAELAGANAPAPADSTTEVVKAVAEGVGAFANMAAARQAATAPPPAPLPPANGTARVGA